MGVGISGVAYALEEHGAAKHTDVTRKLFIPWSHYTGATLEVAKAPFASILLNNASEVIYFNSRVPADFVSFVKVNIIYLQIVGSPITSSVGIVANHPGDDEAYSSSTETLAAQAIGATDLNDINVENTGLVLSGLVVGDFLGISITYHDDSIYVFGLELEYVAVQ
jgi:hypothetical protein